MKTLNIAGKAYKIEERKSSQFGTPGHVSRSNELSLMWLGKPQGYYDNINRDAIYTTARDLYAHDQLARPIIDLIVNGVFNRPPDFQGDEDLVKRANQITRDSNINWHQWGVGLEIFGDAFLRKFMGRNAKIASLPPATLKIDYDKSNILDILNYIQFPDEANEESIPSDEIEHVKIHATPDMAYGMSTLRPAFWWFDVLDNLWERNWIRAAQYYGAPIVVISGVPGDSQAAVQTSIQSDGQRPGKGWVFPEGCKAETLDFTKNYPIENLIDRVYQYILACCGIPQHLVYESDSSRGVAMFSGDAFEMMIASRRQIWERSLINILKSIFIDEGMWKNDSQLNIGWAPLFQRDIKDVVKLIQMATDGNLLSKRTAREKLGVDHSEELERLKQQEKDEPDKVPEVPNPMAPAPKAAPNKQVPPTS